jgi:hypothetical protein
MAITYAKDADAGAAVVKVIKLALVAFVASPESAYITGANLTAMAE